MSNEFNNRETENKSANEPEQTVDKTDADIETELEKPVNTPASESKVRTDKKISLSTFIFSAIALVLAAVMTTYACCGAFYKKKLAEEKLNNIAYGASYEGYEAIALIEALFKTYGYYDDIDDDQVVNYVLKAYVAATGDVHAQYYTKEEYAAMLADSMGQGVGLGVTVIPAVISYAGEAMTAIEIVDVVPNGPAENVGVAVGDLITWFNTDDGEISVNELGYSEAQSMLKGDVGTIAKFTVLRPIGTDSYEKKTFEAERRNVTYRSVTSKVSETDSKIGIVKISAFDTVTPEQFCENMDRLIEGGCEKFVFDMRYNLGGDLNSVRAILSYFLNEGDIILSTLDKNGKREEIKTEPVTHNSEKYISCNVEKSDIGKYRDYDFSVICNGRTASAAELFAAAFRDYDLAKIVGERTHGKGSAQNVIPLEQFGYDGALKITTKLYFPPCGEGYDGEGIIPDVSVTLSDDAKKYSIYKLPQSLDDQLIAAIGTLK